MVVHMTETSDQSSFVRRALQANAVFSAVTGSVALFGAGPVSRFLGLGSTWIVASIGAGVLFWAGYALFVSRASPVDTSKVKEIIAGDIAWVVASIAIVVSGWPELTSDGRWTVAIVADMVLLFAVLQYLGLRKLR